jgi:hypothetical protein
MSKKKSMANESVVSLNSGKVIGFQAGVDARWSSRSCSIVAQSKAERPAEAKRTSSSILDMATVQTHTGHNASTAWPASAAIPYRFPPR